MTNVYVFYDARPLILNVAAYKCEIVKYTNTGFRIKNLDAPGKYEDVLYQNDGTARGWKTLTWHEDASPYTKIYDELRRRMKEQEA
jgi:hypothetical protein